jgi:hypothetical protein
MLEYKGRVGYEIPTNLLHFGKTKKGENTGKN